MISVKEINQMQTKRVNMKKELYKQILAQFSKKIKLSVEMGQTQVFLTVPEFVFGYPTFDREAATVYLKRQLELLGYMVNHYSQYQLYVTWVFKTEKEEQLDILPSLVNIRKAADSIRKKHGM